MKKFIKVLGIFIASLLMVGCDKDEDITQSTDIDIDLTTIGEPSLDKYLTTTYLDGFSIRARFNNGGDDTENMSCTVYWKAYSSKPSKTPKASDLTKAESMRVYASTKIKTTFDKSHAGYGKGTYIYYYMKCRNSRYSCTTSVTHTVVGR